MGNVLIIITPETPLLVIKNTPLEKWGRENGNVWKVNLPVDQPSEKNFISLKDNETIIEMKYEIGLGAGWAKYTKKHNEFADLRSLLDRLKIHHEKR